MPYRCGDQKRSRGQGFVLWVEAALVEEPCASRLQAVEDPHGLAACLQYRKTQVTCPCKSLSRV